MSNLSDNVKIEQLLNPINATTALISDSADIQGFYECLLVANIGFSLDSLNSSRFWTIQLQESDDNSAFADVADGDTAGGAATQLVNSSTLDETAYVFTYRGAKRYVRMTITNTGSHSVGTPMGVTALLAQPALGPVSE